MGHTDITNIHKVKVANDGFAAFDFLLLFLLFIRLFNSSDFDVPIIGS